MMCAARSSKSLRLNKFLQIPEFKTNIRYICNLQKFKRITSRNSYILPRGATHCYSSVRSMSSALPNYKVANLPSLSPTMETGTIQTWEKNVGDELKEGDTLVQIETDKAVMNWETPYPGYLAKKFYPDHTKDIIVNQPIAIIVKNKQDVDSFKDFTLNDLPGQQKKDFAPSDSVKSQEPKISSKIESQSTQDVQHSRIFASPYAKNLASKLNVNLINIVGTGPGGRILGEDVKSSGLTLQNLSSDISVYQDVPMTNMRKIIAKRLLESKQTIPHYYLSSDINMDKCIEIQKKLNDKYSGKFKLTINDFVIKASSLALMKVPQCNSLFMGDFIRMYNDADISIAVSTEEGLITPILRAAQKKGLLEISTEAKQLALKVRNKQILPHEYQGGSFSISNLGMYGVDFFSAVINPPQTCILAVGCVRNIPNNTDDFSISSTKKMYVTLSCDHRAVDGAVAAQWLRAFREYLEDPVMMIV